MKTALKFFILFTSVICLNGVASTPVMAQKALEAEKEREAKRAKWKNFISISGIFETKFPVEYKYKKFPFQFNEHSVAFTTEIASSLNGLKNRSTEKSILIKATQTFGTELTVQEVNKALKREMFKYRKAAKAMNGSLLSEDDFRHKGGFLGKRFYITYNYKGETYGLRIQVIMTNYARVEQVLSGPANSIYSFRSNDFLDSIRLSDGRFVQKDPDSAVAIGTGWVKYTSPNKIFTAKLPPQNSDYTPDLPKFSAKPDSESMTFVIKDPVISKDVTYNAYAYKTKNSVSSTLAKNYIFTKHISKYVNNANPNNLNVDHYKDGKINKLKTKIVITPTAKYPGISNIFIEARYSGNTLVIQEFLTSRPHSRSEMHNTFFSLLDFHPEKYSPVRSSKKTKE